MSAVRHELSNNHIRLSVKSRQSVSQSVAYSNSGIRDESIIFGTSLVTFLFSNDIKQKIYRSSKKSITSNSFRSLSLFFTSFNFGKLERRIRTRLIAAMMTDRKGMFCLHQTVKENFGLESNETMNCACSNFFVYKQADCGKMSHFEKTAMDSRWT